MYFALNHYLKTTGLVHYQHHQFFGGKCQSVKITPLEEAEDFRAIIGCIDSVCDGIMFNDCCKTLTNKQKSIVNMLMDGISPCDIAETMGYQSKALYDVFARIRDKVGQYYQVTQ